MFNQGIQFEKYGKDYYKDNEHKLLANTSSPEWGSAVEAFNTNQPITITPLSSDAMQFNNLVSTYSTLYNTYTETMLKKQPTDADRIVMETALTDEKVALILAANKINANMPGANMPGANMPGANMPGANMPIAKQYDEITIAGQIETTKLREVSFYYHFIVYSLVTLTLVSFIFYYMFNPDAINIIYVAVGLVMVFIISRFFVL